MRIALVDDNLDELDYVASFLQESGFSCEFFSNGEAVISGLRRETFDALLLDWNMTGISGMEVLAWVQANLELPPPVLIFTGRDSKDDIVHALNAGAADFISKPEDPEIVRARIGAVVRQSALTNQYRNDEFGGYRFDDVQRSIRFGDNVFDLRQKEYELARLLFENLDRPLSRGYIMQRIWQSNPKLETRTLDVHISRLRSVLGLRPDRGFTLQTIVGYGYRLMNCPNERLMNSTTPPTLDRLASI